MLEMVQEKLHKELNGLEARVRALERRADEDRATEGIQTCVTMLADSGAVGKSVSPGGSSSAAAGSPVARGDLV